MSFLGEPISSDVSRQIEKRQELIAQNPRTVATTQLLSSNSGWVRLISGVNTIPSSVPDSEYQDLSRREQSELTSPDLARSFILSPVFDRSNLYTSTENFGIRPRPGLTSFNVVTKGTYGAVREIKIGFNVYSKEDLDTAERLFFRPGMPMIVEWGNSLYTDNSSESNIFRPNQERTLSEFFNTTSIEKVLDLLEEYRSESFYNYDAALGYVTNFSFSFNEDGFYECTITVVTHGSILNGITSNNRRKLVNPIPSETEGDSSYKPDFIVYLESLIKLANRLISNPEPGSLESTIITFQDYSSELRNQYQENSQSTLQALDVLKDYFGEGRTNFNIIRTRSLSSEPSFSNSFDRYYITLGALLDICKLSFSIYNPDSPSSATLVNFETDISNSYASFKDHFSTNPFVTFLPKPIDGKDSEGNPILATQYLISPSERKLKDYINFELLDIGKNKVNIQDYFKYSDTVNPILEIRLELNYLINKFRKIFLDNANGTLQVFIESILKDVEKYTGSINEYDLIFDEDTFKYNIVDRNINPTVNFSTIVEDRLPSIINVFGRNSTVTQLDLTSKISNELSNSIAISAQASSGLGSSSEDIALSEYNVGLAPRYFLFDETDFPDPTISNLKVKSNLGVKKNTFKNLWERFKKWNIRNTSPGLDPLDPRGTGRRTVSRLGEIENSVNVTIDSDLSYYNVIARIYSTSLDRKNTFNLIEDITSEYSSRAHQSIFVEQSEDLKAFQAIIPVELSMTITGIGGLKIGQVFRINDDDSPGLLPSLYNDYAFLITGLDHTIDGQNSKWFTTIKGLTYKFR